jgi:hypothetical protein
LYRDPRPGRLVTVPLSDRQKAILDFERSWWTSDVAKDSRIEELFGCDAVAYYQELNVVLEQEDALAYDPLVVRRLRRLRDRRRRARLDGAMPTVSGGSSS